MQQARQVAASLRQQVVQSARLYLALCRAAADVRADAVTVDCKGVCATGALPAYPCLSHFQMNNDGATAVCRGDLNAACAQLLMRYLAYRPGFLAGSEGFANGDHLIYWHSTCTNRVFGTEDRTSPYILHPCETEGPPVVVQTMMPLGEPITTLAIDVSRRRITMEASRTAAIQENGRACRVKMAARPLDHGTRYCGTAGGDVVGVFGDWRKRLTLLARLSGLTLSEGGPEV